MRITPEISGVQIVLIGSLNPRIFRPEWFASNGIIGAGDAASAVIEIIHSELTVFALDWVNLNVQPARFAADTATAPFVRLRDLVVKTFKDYLMHTPIYQMGINRTVHFRVGSYEIKDKIGQMLAPQEPWGSWAALIPGKSPSNLAKRGGMKSLTMGQNERDDGHEGSVNVSIEPSVRVGIDGIYMAVNDHYELGPATEILGSDRAIMILEKEWDRSIQRAEGIIDQIMALEARAKADG